MSRNPFINAASATLYITAVAMLTFYGKIFFGPKDTILTPIAVLSLFSLSAAIMAYLFLYQPILLYLDGKKKQATQLFTRTILTFAGITVVIFILLSLGLFK